MKQYLIKLWNYLTGNFINKERESMMSKNRIVYGNRWIAYFDILGFKNLVKKYEGNIDTFTKAIYNEILGEITKRSERISKALNIVDYAWFSDSFIIFTEDDTLPSFSAIDIFSWEFFQKMMFAKHPLRGALSVGELYTDKERNTYIGPALIDAYRFAEKQKWIGLVLTPKAYDKLSESGYAIDLTRYSENQVPIKPEVKEKEKLFIRNIVSLKRDIIQAQKSAMNEEEYEEKLKVKYENTLKLIEHLEKSK